jgi:hypothetical protein
MAEPIIDDDNYHWLVNDPIVNGHVMSRGLVARDLNKFPVGCYAAAPAWSPDAPVIPRSEWSERIKEMERTKSRLSDIRNIGDNGKPIRSLDQNGQGYCWAYASTAAVMLLRAVQGLPHVRMSAHAVGCKVKGFRDQGGWSAQSLDFIKEQGVPSVEKWPEKSMNRSNDRPDVWANAARHKFTEGFVELNAAVYDRDLTFDQVMTCLLSRIPVPVDLMWWGHAVCAVDPVEVEPGSFGIRIWNSWTDNWGEKGMGVIRGQKAIPDNAVAPRVAMASL